MPALVAQPATPPAGIANPAKRNWWSFLVRPAFAMPAYAALLLALGFQTFVNVPQLRNQADQPRLLAFAHVHEATRGGAATNVNADRKHGIALPIDLSPAPGSSAYATYAFDLVDSEGKTIWTGRVAAPPASETGEMRITLALPGGMLRNGAYAVEVSGIGPGGDRTPVERYAFNVAITD